MNSLLRFIFVSLVSLSVYSQEINLEKLTMGVSGKIAFPMAFNKEEEFLLSLDVAPRFGIFVINNLELGIDFYTKADFVFSENIRLVPTPVKWGLTGEVVYYFDTPSRFTPYLGGGLGIRIMNANLLSLNLAWSTPVGTLISLGKNFAIDIGIGLKGLMSVRSIGERIELTPGFIGFRYFFRA
jgi:hypothetical protein